MCRTITLLTLALIFFLQSIYSQNHQNYRDSIADVIKKLPSDSLKAVEYYNAAIYAFQPLNNLKLSRIYADSAMYYSQASKIKDQEATCYFLYGFIERFEGKYDLALEHFNKHIEYFKKRSIDKPYSLFQIAAIHGERGEYDKSLKILYEISKIFEEEKDSFALASTYNSIAVDFYEMNKIEESLANLKKALDIFQKLNEKKDIANTSRNIGEAYLSKHDTLTGIEYVEKSLEVAKEINESYEIGYSSYILGNALIKSDPKKGLRYMLEAKSIMEKGDYKSLLTDINISIGQYYENENNYSKAISYNKAALKLAEELKELPPKEKIYKNLSSIYERQRDFENALNHMAKYMTIKDSLLNIENLKTINLLEIQYETEKKEKDLLALSEQKLKDEAALGKQRAWIRRLSFGLGGAILLFGAALVIFRQRVHNQRQKELIAAIADTQIAERKRISQDLHDSVGGSLALAKTRLQAFCEQGGEKSKELGELLKTLTKTGEQVRQISHNLMPGELVKFGLVSAVQTILDQLQDTELKAQLYAHNMEKRIDPTKEIHLFRIVQEIIQNVIKHAKADQLSVYLNKHKKHLSLMVEDNGVGMESPSKFGMGIVNIESRVAYLKGTLNIDSALGKGTTMNIEIPL